MRKNSNQLQYNKWWSDFTTSNAEDPGTLYRANLIINQIKKLNVETIVDCGCGPGELIKKVFSEKQLGNLRISGCDVADKVIESNKKAFPNLDFFTLDLNEETKIHKNFDLAICSEVIEHLKNWKVAIYNLNQLVKGDGYLILTTQSGKRYKHHLALGHIRHFTIEEIGSELNKNGFEIIEGHYCGWPFMDLKNILSDNFFSRIEKSLLKAKKQNLSNRLVFKIFGFLYSVSSNKKGPQIFILAKKRTN